MTHNEQQAVMTDAVWELVDLYVEDDEDVAVADHAAEEATR